MSSKIKNALISLSDKGELERLLKILRKFNINIISSGGTFAEIKKLGYKCTEVSKFTKFLPNSKNYMSFNFKIKKFFSGINFDKKYLNTMWISSMTAEELKDYFQQDLDLNKILPEINELFSNIILYFI